MKKLTKEIENQFLKKLRKKIKKFTGENTLTEQSGTTNWSGGQYQYHFCAFDSAGLSNPQSQNYSCPNARYIKAESCDPADTQNYFLVTEINGNVPSVGDIYCGAATSNLDPVNTPAAADNCAGPTLKITQVYDQSQLPGGFIVEPRMNVGGCPSTTTNPGGVCDQMVANYSTPGNWEQDVNAFGWEQVFDCVISRHNNPCALLERKLKGYQDKLASGVGPNYASLLNYKINYATNLGAAYNCGLSPGQPTNVVGQSFNFDLPTWTNTFTNQVSNAQNPCNLLNNKISGWQNKISSGVGASQESMLNQKILVAQGLLPQYNC